ncbi:MAG: four helix bundle protein [candidate division KSB1 bacterium]|nr:four helix bundle protein [candidate division KSB1 bacterium]MDZ7368774.1 four helix bundle protein [candidate division KSB1 bacterium]MDZ7406584.1 four helix bundle protein [candidate division KSB1 bacterium]
MKISRWEVDFCIDALFIIALVTVTSKRRWRIRWKRCDTSEQRAWGRGQKRALWCKTIQMYKPTWEVGYGKISDKEFGRFLDIARREVFENANITIILFRRKLIDEKEQNDFLDAFELLSKRITSFKKTLNIEN